MILYIKFNQKLFILAYIQFSSRKRHFIIFNNFTKLFSSFFIQTMIKLAVFVRECLI